MILRKTETPDDRLARFKRRQGIKLKVLEAIDPIDQWFEEYSFSLVCFLVAVVVAWRVVHHVYG